jgi:hypothetical protein
MVAVGADAHYMWLTLSELAMLFDASSSLQPGFNVTLLPGSIGPDVVDDTVVTTVSGGTGARDGSMSTVTMVVVGACAGFVHR